MPNLENSRSARTQYKRLQVAAYCRVSTQHSGELLITILSSQAQEESRNISENCHWGTVRQFENGVVRVNCKKFLGYTRDEDGNLVIVPEEAELVRRILRLF